MQMNICLGFKTFLFAILCNWIASKAEKSNTVQCTMVVIIIKLRAKQSKISRATDKILYRNKNIQALNLDMPNTVSTHIEHRLSIKI